MPLPYAPPPKDSKVYRDLKNLKISEVTSDQMDTLKNQLYAQGIDGSEDEMRRLILLGAASQSASLSGPIPGTFQVVETSLTAPTTYSMFECPNDEVWQIVASGTEAFATNQSYLILKLQDNNSGKSVRIDSISSGYTEFTMNEPIYIGGSADGNTSEVLIQGGESGTWSGTNTVQLALIRVR